tara:strand:+ start:1844 stop:2134 length:291 start_codon:yes stop_codon:yes gene_type:complete
MAKSLDKVLQPDGSWKWELVEPGLSERMGNTPGTVCPAPEPKKKEKLELQQETISKFEDMTKAQLETYGRTIGLELDKRHNKADLIAELQKFTSAS